MQINDIKVFVPSKDFQQSQAFYQAMGFQASPVSEQLVLFSQGNCAFFLQDFYEVKLAENLMLQLQVQDIDAAYQQCQQLPHKSRISTVQSEPWGEVFYLWGPAGELLHITRLNQPDN